MTPDILIVTFIAVCSIIMLVFQLVRYDLVAILIMASLSITGVLDPVEAVAGFSNSATMTVLSMFVLSKAVSNSGLLQIVGKKIYELSNGHKNRTFLFLMIFVGISSMFVNNTAAVALLVPVTLDLCYKVKLNPAQVLMPISFISMAGGVCTLIGTSTNLIANDILIIEGFDEFSMFSFFKYGISYFIVTLIYLYFFSDKLLPRRNIYIGHKDQINNVISPKKVIFSFLVFSTTITLAAIGFAPIYTMAFIAIGIFVLFRVISIDQIYYSVDWKIIFLLAGLLALGRGMEETGMIDYVFQKILPLLSNRSTNLIVGCYFLISILLTSVLSNNAAIVFLAPFALRTASSIQVDSEIMLLVVMFGSSLSFLTPVGYQTNMMVMSFGKYTVIDFFKFGMPLTILLFFLTLFVFT